MNKAEDNLNFWEKVRTGSLHTESEQPIAGMVNDAGQEVGKVMFKDGSCTYPECLRGGAHLPKGSCDQCARVAGDRLERELYTACADAKAMARLAAEATERARAAEEEVNRLCAVLHRATERERQLTVQYKELNDHFKEIQEQLDEFI